MIEPTLAEKARRKGLKAKRNILFEEYLKSPRDARLALEIKSIDDIAKSIEGTKVVVEKGK